MANGIMDMEIKGIARDSHTKFPIKFEYSEKGTAYLVGVRMEVTRNIGGKDVTSRMDLRAFGEQAEQLAHISDGDEIHVKGEYGQRKGTDDKWYPVLTVSQVLSA